MRDHQHVCAFCHVNNFAPDGEPAAASKIRLQNVNFAAFDEMFEAPLGGLLLTTGDKRFYRFGYMAIAIVVFWMQNFFHEKGPKWLDGPDYLHRLFRSTFDEPSGID